MGLKELKGRKILILGFGKEGSDALKFLRETFSAETIGVADRSRKKIPWGVKGHFGANYLEAVKEYDIIIKSPGIPISLVRTRKDQAITSSTDLFLNSCKGTVLGVTGTKGKSTTCTLIYNVLKSRGIEAFLVGNIGKPALDHLLKDKRDNVYVYELSSFQLETATESPKIAIILNIFKDHLDHHRNFKEYIEAKERIFKFQKKNDILIYNKKSGLVKKIVQKSKSRKIPFDPEKNLSLFFEVGKIFDIPEAIVREEAGKLKPLPHRMEYVGNFKGIDFYNDSAATIPEAAILAIEKLKNIETIIVGGVDKGFKTKKLSEKIAGSGIKNVIIFPETGTKIKKEIAGLNKKIKVVPVKSMEEAVSACYQKTKKGRAALLSPAASSFNMFKNYKERGSLFKKYVKNEKD